MRRTFQLALLAAAVLALPPAVHAQDMRQTLSEEIRMQHQRSHELQQVGQSDQQMAQQLNNEAQGLIDHATRLEQRAQQFRQMAAAQRFNQRNAQQLNHFADECEKYAHSDRSNVDFRRRVANDMNASGQGALDAARNHEEHAQRMQQFLDQMNQGQQQPPPMQQQNPWQ